jgi:putative ABC transport system permease protein
MANEAERVFPELKFVLRSLVKNPLFTGVATLSLALGIGANAAIFSLLDQVLLRSLPVKNPQQLVSFDWDGTFSGFAWGAHTFSYPMYTSFRNKTSGIFSGVIARFGTQIDVGWNGVAERANGELVSGNYFPVLGVAAAIGRTFTPADDLRRNAEQHVVLSYAYWQKRFRRNPGVLNQIVDVNGHPMTVIGIAQPGFKGTDPGAVADVFLPMMMKAVVTPTWDKMDDRRAIWLNIVGRLQPNVSLRQAEAEATVLYRQEQNEDLKTNPNATPRFRSKYLQNKFTLVGAGRGLSSIRDQFSTPLLVLMAMVGTLLLIACGNVANLLIARGAARQKETAVRLSLGASTFAIIRLVLIESIALSLAGGALGLLMASWSGSILMQVLPFNTFAPLISTSPDKRILFFTFAVSVVTAVLFGLIPALQIAKPDLMKTLKNEARAVIGGQLKLRKGMVTAQIALSLLLLIGAGLFTRSLSKLMDTATGIRTDHVLSFSLDPSLSNYSDQNARQLFQRLQAEVMAIPGVQAVSAAEQGLLANNQEMATTRVEGYPYKEGENLNPTVNHVLPGFFSAMGIPLIAGREFTERDIFGAPKVAIVNETFARYFFKDQNPLGLHIGFGDPLRAKTDMEVIGIVKDVKQIDLKKAPENQVWTASLQSEHPSVITFYVRTYSDPKATSALVRRVIRRMDPALPLFDVKTLTTQINETQYVDRLISILSAAFGILATSLAAVGLYGLMAYTVARRTPELGIRMALGAQQRTVLQLVMFEVCTLTASGIGVGLPLAFGLGRYVQTQLFEIRPNDPFTLVSATSILAVVALLAGYIPALRATRIDPAIALRWE